MWHRAPEYFFNFAGGRLRFLKKLRCHSGPVVSDQLSSRLLQYTETPVAVGKALFDE